MVSKCANPECSEQFRYLHQGKLFHLTPTPEVQAATGGFSPWMDERFWLCDECSRKMTVVWDGTHAKVVNQPEEAFVPYLSEESKPNARPKRRPVLSGRRGD